MSTQEKINAFYATAEQGKYFEKKNYEKLPLPKFEFTKSKLPKPIFDNNKSYVDCYWKAWEIAFQNFHEPKEGSKLVSQYIDAAFSTCIFLWDTCFMTMFCNYAHPYIPGIVSLDNFYACQFETGEICREIDNATGRSLPVWDNYEDEPLFSRWGFNWHHRLYKSKIEYKGREVPSPNPRLTLDAVNHPLLAWAELESYKITGDTLRLEKVWDALVKHYESYKKYIQQGNGLYMCDSAGMDNSSRNEWLSNGGTVVDTSAEMVLFARCLAEIGEIIGPLRYPEALKYRKEAGKLSGIINEKMWNQKNKFYYDLTFDEQYVPVKTIAAFWTLISEVASRDQAKYLIDELNNPETFKTEHRVPTMAANEPQFNAENGCYWRGAIWAPTNTMVIRGLEKYGYTSLAKEIAMNHLNNVVDVYKETSTLYENYSPSKAKKGDPSRPDFVGWSGIAPITYFFEYAIGLKPNGAEKNLTWNLDEKGRVGVEDYWFGGITSSIIASEEGVNGKREVNVKSNSDYTLYVVIDNRKYKFDVKNGENQFLL